ncbi:hypothetical protein FRC09_001970 [Ceratobasidium sp. 395]|nr:hypothetical protein FRC09_001970 [Ceratobasidium sp. 395]
MPLAHAGSSVIVSGSFVPSLNTSLGSSGGHAQGPHKLDFTYGWGHENCPTYQWYMAQPTTTFNCLQYRKVTNSALHHEFIVAELNNDTLCRFDRMGVTDGRGEVLYGNGIEALDTAQVISKADREAKEIELSSELLLRVYFPEGQDLSTILAACHGISVDERAGRYSLMRFNCYFLSWTILITTARRTVDWSNVIREPKLWDELVTSSISYLPTSSDRSKSDPGSMLRRILKANEPTPNEIPPFTGAAYLTETLRKSLIDTRWELSRTLDELVLQSTADKAMNELTQERLRNTANDAARKHAYHAARDAALEAVVETMWQQVFSDPNAGKAWEAASRENERRVRDAAEAAATIDLGEGLEGEGWENAWDMIWGRDDASGLISNRAKRAWKDAWTKACVVNEIYLPRISHNLSSYVTDNIPDSSFDKLKVEKPGALKFRPTVMTNASLQEYIQGRIDDHCKKVANAGVAKTAVSRSEIQDAMQRIWRSSMSFGSG